MSFTTGDLSGSPGGSPRSPAGWLLALTVGLVIGLTAGVPAGSMLHRDDASTCRLADGRCPSRTSPDPGVGDALGDGGSAGIVVTPARPPANGIFLYAFPWLANASADPLTVVGFAIAGVPRNVEVQRFVVLDARETGGRLSTANVGGSQPRFDVRRYHNYAGVPIVVPPGGISHRYALVQVRRVGPVHRLLSGCVVYYRTRGGSFHQRLPCALKLWDMR